MRALLAVAVGLVVGVPALAQDVTATPLSPSAKSQPKPAPIYDEKADAAKDIEAALAKAKKENQRVLIQWGANWCHWCTLLHGTFQKDQKVSRKLMYEYVVVRVDIGRFDKNMDLVAKYGASLQDKGVPYLTFLDAEGRVLANEETGALEAKSADGKDGHDASKVEALLTKHQATYLNAQSVLEEAMSRAAKEEKVVLFHMGAPWCGWCHRMEDWMAKPEVKAILEKDFVDLKIDQDRMVGAKDIEARFNKDAGKTGIPWFAFLKPDGTILSNSMGPKGNVGFPYQPEEVEHFKTMLEGARKRISPQEAEALIKSLHANREKDAK